MAAQPERLGARQSPRCSISRRYSYSPEFIPPDEVNSAEDTERRSPTSCNDFFLYYTLRFGYRLLRSLPRLSVMAHKDSGRMPDNPVEHRRTIRYRDDQEGH